MEFRKFTVPIMMIGIWFFGFSLGWSDGSPEQDALTATVKANNAFAFDFYTALAQEKGNLFFSPYSISSALAMTYAGAHGETAKQMEKTLHFNEAASKLNAGYSELMKAFNIPGKKFQLAVANALWGQQGTEFFPQFVNTVTQYYNAGFQNVDYVHDTERARQTINRWVEEKTEHKVVELIKSGILNGLTRLVLTNAIYFKGGWKLQFKPENTSESPFYGPTDTITNVPLMRQRGKFYYSETNQCQLLELPYSGDEVVMDVLLPKSPSNLDKLESTLQSAHFEAWLNAMSGNDVEVFLPRFKVENDLTLNKYLRDLGMEDAFDEQKADFSGMSTTFLYITRVLHKTFVGVDENGTEAAAATAVVMGTRSALVGQPVVFRADHPFIFLIRDRRSGSILFMGRVVDPRS